MRDNRKFFIGLVQDFCNKNDYGYESERFSLSFCSNLARVYESKQITKETLKKELLKYNYFIFGNNINVDLFVNAIYREIRSLYDYQPNSKDIFAAILDFKSTVEGNLYSAFRVSKNPKEETGRTLLQAYLKPRGFREAQMAGGNCDLVFHDEDTIVETKIWHDTSRYLDGIEELCAYLEAQGFLEGYYIIFDNTQGVNSIVKEKGTPVFVVNSGKYIIHVVFININPVAPSKRRRQNYE